MHNCDLRLSVQIPLLACRSAVLSLSHVQNIWALLFDQPSYVAQGDSKNVLMQEIRCMFRVNCRVLGKARTQTQGTAHMNPDHVKVCGTAEQSITDLIKGIGRRASWSVPFDQFLETNYPSIKKKKIREQRITKKEMEKYILCDYNIK